MRGQTGVFPGQDAALVGDKLAEEVDVLEIERIGGEIDFRLRPLGAHFDERTAATRAAGVALFRASFARHRGCYLISR